MRSQALVALLLAGCFVNDVSETSTTGEGNGGPGPGSASGAAGPGGAGAGGAGAGGASPGGSGGEGASGGVGPGGGGSGGNPTCGDGLIQAGEQCEDGNNEPDDQCDDCQFEPGCDGDKIGASEDCDEGMPGTSDCSNCAFTGNSPCAGLQLLAQASPMITTVDNCDPFVTSGNCSGLNGNAPTFGFRVNTGEFPRGVLIRTDSMNPNTRVFASEGCAVDLDCSPPGFPSLATDIMPPGSIRAFGIAHPPSAFQLAFTRHRAPFTLGAFGWSNDPGFTFTGMGLHTTNGAVASEAISPPIYVGGVASVELSIFHNTSTDGRIDIKLRGVGGAWSDALDALDPMEPLQGITAPVPVGATDVEVGFEITGAVTSTIVGVLVIEAGLVPTGG